MVHLNLICDHNVAFKRAQDGSNRLSNLRLRCEFDGSRHINHISGYISGTGSCRHNPFTLVQCLYNTFRMSLRLSKSVQPSQRKRYEKGCTYIYTRTCIYSIHTQTFPISASWVEWYITLGVSEAPLKSRSLQQFYYLSLEKGITKQSNKNIKFEIKLGEKKKKTIF